ncbi:MAG: hypothetical protein AMK70_12130 [Nitrospira bacterium SG8_35_1]|nr:MAG: hypothetical protein AMK70_12130 [Nitrospira bacterium SG8_35_1]
MLYYCKTMELSNYSRIFKALSNEQRLKIFMMIYKNCSTEKGDSIKAEFRFKEALICDCMNLSRSTVSHHFKELQNAGLITCEREGQTYRCHVNEDAVQAVKNFLS